MQYIPLGHSSFDVFNFRLDRFVNEQGFAQHYKTVASKVEKAIWHLTKEFDFSNSVAILDLNLDKNQVYTLNWALDGRIRIRDTVLSL
jgi:hypothetical protein